MSNLINNDDLKEKINSQAINLSDILKGLDRICPNCSQEIIV